VFPAVEFIVRRIPKDRKHNAGFSAHGVRKFVVNPPEFRRLALAVGFARQQPFNVERVGACRTADARELANVDFVRGVIDFPLIDTR
jgi:hypothetical protein